MKSFRKKTSGQLFMKRVYVKIYLIAYKLHTIVNIIFAKLILRTTQ